MFSNSVASMVLAMQKEEEECWKGKTEIQIPGSR
jgi:hypothetical protein